MLATMASSPIAARQSKLDFTLMNSTGLTIQEINVGPHDSDDWGPDILGSDVMENGQSADITFAPAAPGCDWDLKIKDAGGNEVEWFSLNLCEASHITLRYADGKATAIVK